jgi:hypothetical protein
MPPSQGWEKPDRNDSGTIHESSFLQAGSTATRSRKAFSASDSLENSPRSHRSFIAVRIRLIARRHGGLFPLRKYSAK